MMKTREIQNRYFITKKERKGVNVVYEKFQEGKKCAKRG